MINWLYVTSLETSLIIGVILIIRPIVRRLLGAQIIYFLWALPLIRAVMPDRMVMPEVFSRTGLQSDGVPLDTSFVEVMYISDAAPVIEIWFSGIVVCVVIQLVLQSRFSSRIKRQAVPYSFANKKNLALVKDSGLGGDRFISSDVIDAPFISGLIKAKIFLPATFEQRFSTADQYWILRHEIMHHRRRDLWLQFVGEIFRALFWFNPVVHFALRSFREDQEMACDQSTLAGCNAAERFQYGKALIRAATPQLVPSILTFFTNSKERFIMLKTPRSSKLNTMTGVALCLLLAGFTLTKAPVSIAQSEQRPVFEEVYDASLTKKFTGKIKRIDYAEHVMFIHVDAEHEDGTVTSWLVEGGSYKEMHAAGLDSIALSPGRYVTITGYQSKDQSCNPSCKLNGRDLTFPD